MTITHIVIFTWRDSVTSAEIAELEQALDRMAADMADLVTNRHGPDLRFREGNGDYALVATLIDRAAWDAYQEDPRHKAFVRDFVTPLAASRVAVQF
jgi:hypothetical protein